MLHLMREIRINVRTTEAIKRDLEIVAELRGITVSSLVNQMARVAIREERDREPSAFDLNPKRKAPVVAHPAAKEVIRKTYIGDDIDELGTVDYTDEVSRQAERIRLSLLKADAPLDDPEAFDRAFRDAEQQASKIIAKKRKAKG